MFVKNSFQLIRIHDLVFEDLFVHYLLVLHFIDLIIELVDLVAVVLNDDVFVFDYRFQLHLLPNV